MIIDTKNGYSIKITTEENYTILYVLDEFDGTSFKIEMYDNQIQNLINELTKIKENHVK